MPDVDIETALEWRGRTVVDRAGEKVGTLKEIYLDESERPHWGSVHTGLFGLRQTLVPLYEAQADDDVLRLPFARDHIMEAPNLEPDTQLSTDEEERLYRHYDLGPDDGGPDDARDVGAVAAGAADADDADDADDAMTRSEEVVQFGKRRRERGRARLKKYVVTDYVEKKVPVRREEVRLEFDDEDRDPGR